MSELKLILDTTMCVLWILTYTLVLIGTKKYSYPLISPITQAIIAPLEWSCLFLLYKLGAEFNYAAIAYIYWGFIEVAIFFAILKLGYIKKRFIKPYIAMVAVITLVMVYFVTIKEKMLFCNYINTFLGILIWAGFIFNKNYPMNGISLTIFIIKFFADVFAAIVYYGENYWLVNLLCILLPIVDFCFIPVWAVRKVEQKRKH